LRKTALFCIAIMLVIASVAAFAEPVTLEYKFKVGDVDKYKMAMAMSMEMPGLPAKGGAPAMNFSMTMSYIQKVLAVNPDGTAKVQVTYGDMKFSGLPGDAKAKADTEAKTKAMAGQVMTAIMTKRGQMLSVQGMDKVMAAAGMPSMDFSKFLNSASNQALLPEGPVDVGQSWKQEVPMPFGSGRMSVTSTLDSTDQQLWGLQAAKVSQAFDGSFDIAEVLKAMMGGLKAGTKGAPDLSSMSGTVNLNGKMDFLFAPAIGKLLNGGGSMQMKLTMNLPPEAVKQGAPASVDMNMNMQINITRYK